MNTLLLIIFGMLALFVLGLLAGFLLAVIAFARMEETINGNE